MGMGRLIRCYLLAISIKSRLKSSIKLAEVDKS